MMVIVSSVTLLALSLAQRSLTGNFEEELQREFQGQLNAFERAQEVRRAALVERCRALVRKPRIRAAFEDDALDLLYLNAESELNDVLMPVADDARVGLHAEFYRFLDRAGAVIPPANRRTVGALTTDEEAQLALPAISDQPQIGYLARKNARGDDVVTEVIAMPILSTETGEPIAALVLGFKPFEFAGRETAAGMTSGIYLSGQLHGARVPPALSARIGEEITRATDTPVRIKLDGVPHLLMAKRLNGGSAYAPAFEASVYPLTELLARQEKLRLQVLGAGALLLLLALAGSHFASARLSAPVERLAVDSEENRTQRARAEAALELTSADLQRSARFSADASHQLKTPVTVLRAGLEEWLAREHLTPEECAQVSGLIHQTYRLSSLIEDLLLLSRMDAGRLKLELAPVNLSRLIEASLDDLSALPDELDVRVETDFPSELYIAGEKRYTAIILQNLLENARKYNRPGGRIRLSARVEGDAVRLIVGNTGGPIPPDRQRHIFERFHRGGMGEDVPGYGLGLNLARELARLHRGDLKLIRSDETATEFEVSFRAMVPAATSAG